jgi:hypothetical protein
VLDAAISGPLALLDASLTELLTEHGVAKWAGRRRCCLSSALRWHPAAQPAPAARHHPNAAALPLLPSPKH